MLNDGQRFVELGSVNEITRVGHPKDIACLGSYDVGQCATHRHFHFSYLMEEELSKAAIELIKSYGCRKLLCGLNRCISLGKAISGYMYALKR
jgi:isopentenyl diphosphate isomerase/L-lactate dehydrogenase-like FMN-dependent dehydrogenase